MINLESALFGPPALPEGRNLDRRFRRGHRAQGQAILMADDFINLVFTRGIYGVFPMSAVINFQKLSSLSTRHPAIHR